MGQQVTLDELIENDLLVIPDISVSYIISEAKGYDHLGLFTKGGIYLLSHIDSGEIIYIGVSRSLGRRLYAHIRNKRRGHILYHILSEGLTIDFLDNIKVEIILEEREQYQDIYEKYLIGKHLPKYNQEGKQGGRGYTVSKKRSTKIDQLPLTEIVEQYTVGKSLKEIGMLYNVSPPTIKKALTDQGVSIRERGKARYYRQNLLIQKITQTGRV